MSDTSNTRCAVHPGEREHETDHGAAGHSAAAVETAETQAADTKEGRYVYCPALDLFDLGDRYELSVDLPGTTADHIEVSLHDGVLSLEARVPPRYGSEITPLLGEYGVGDYRRRLRLGEDVDGDRLTADYADGVLTLTMPKRAERQPRRIHVSTASPAVNAS